MLKRIPAKFRILSSLMSLCLAAFLFACSNIHASLYSKPEAMANSSGMTVSWTDELRMAKLLANDVSVSSLRDLDELLKRQWYTSIAVAGDSITSSTLNNCETYFAQKTQNLHAQNESAQNGLRELEVMCQATRLLSGATSAIRSNIPTRPLDTALPAHLPKAFAIVTAQTELNRIQQDERKVYWNDVNVVTHTQKQTAFRRTYFSAGAEQSLALLGRGDINRDGEQDLLVTLQDTLTGGSYVNLRLFVLTVNSYSQWRIIEQY